MPESESSLSETMDGMLHLVKRRRWWILITVVAVALGTIGVMSKLPNRFSSEAILVMQQQVLQRYVLPTAGTDNAQMVEAMTRQVLSRTHLVGIIREFELYAEQRKRNATFETLVELLRRDIDIQSLDPRTQPDFNAFKISFTADTPQVAQLVASRLTQLFVDENLRTRESRASSTSTFLKEQLDAAKQKLAEQEQRLRDFKSRYPGELPEQQATNVTSLSELRIEMQNVRIGLSRVQQQRTSLESSANGILARLRAERSTLLIRYTPRYVDVVRKDAEIARAEAVMRILKNEASDPENPHSVPGLEDPLLAELVKQVEANRSEMRELSAQEAQLQSEIAQYQKRLNVTPVREQELAGIVRDYDLAKQQYTDLLSRQLQSQLATSLEESHGSIGFRLIDPPGLPVKPSSPKRLKISLGGLAAGIFLGVALAFLVDMRDRSFYDEKSLRQCFAAPLVLAVPLLLTPAGERRRSWRLGLEWVAGSVMVTAMLIAEFIVYRSS